MVVTKPGRVHYTSRMRVDHADPSGGVSKVMVEKHPLNHFPIMFNTRKKKTQIFLFKNILKNNKIDSKDNLRVHLTVKHVNNKIQH